MKTDLLLTEGQRAALMRFADKEGGQWKTRLREAWNTGRYPAHVLAQQEDAAYLQQVRNTQGPVWLGSVKLDQLRAAGSVEEGGESEQGMRPGAP